MSIESVTLSNHFILCTTPTASCPYPFAASASFPVSQLFALGSQSIGASASASVLPMNIQGRFPLGLTGLISLQSKGLSRVFSSMTIQKHQFFGAQLSLEDQVHTSRHGWLGRLVTSFLATYNQSPLLLSPCSVFSCFALLHFGTTT